MNNRIREESEMQKASRPNLGNLLFKIHVQYNRDGWQRAHSSLTDYMPHNCFLAHVGRSHSLPVVTTLNCPRSAH